MKKIIYASLILGGLTVSCSSSSLGDFTQSFFGEKLFGLTEEEKFLKKLASYDLEATIKTNKGDINVFLYPDAAPETVANFVFLSKNNFYDGLSFFRVVPNLVIQTGDPTNTGLNGSGYIIDDEFNSYLNYNNEGMVGMANAGQYTTSSQFFITLVASPEFNGRYTVFGSIKNKDDLSVAKSIEQGDNIETVTINGKKVNEFLSLFSEQTSKWEEVLKSNKELKNENSDTN